MRRKKQHKTNISNLICHIEIPVSVARQWWCNNVVWWWLEFGHGGWRVEKMVLVEDDAVWRCWCDNVVCVRWVENIFKIQNEDKIMHICSTISICQDGAWEKGFWNSKSCQKKSRLTKMVSNWTCQFFRLSIL